MKLTKKSWLLLTLGVFVITFASLGAIQSQQVRQQKRLNEELALAELRLEGFQLEQLSAQQEVLEEQLKQTISQSETTKTILSQSIGSITSSSTLFDIAQAYGVEVTEFSSSGLASGDLDGIPCSVLTLNARVEGDISDLISFIMKLNSELTTGVVKSVEISMSEATSEAKSSANIQLVLYTYQGD